MSEFIKFPNGALLRASSITGVIPYTSSIQISVSKEGPGTLFYMEPHEIPLELKRIEEILEKLPPPKVEVTLDANVLGDAVFKALSNALDTRNYSSYSHFGNLLIAKLGTSVKEAIRESLNIPEFTTMRATKTLGEGLVKAWKDILEG